MRVYGPEGEGEVSFEVRVQEPGFLDNPYLILVAALLPLVLVGWWLKSGESLRQGVRRAQGACEGQTRKGDESDA